MSSPESINTDVDLLQVYDSISLQLTYSKPISSLSPDGASVSNALPPSHLGKANTTPSPLSYDSTDITSSYGSDFHSTADDNNILSKDGTSTLSTSSYNKRPATSHTFSSSEAVEDQTATERTGGYSCVSNSSAGSGGYSSNFDSTSMHTSTNSQSMPSEKDLYADDFHSLTQSDDKSYATDFETHSHATYSESNVDEYTQTFSSLTGEDEIGGEIPSSVLFTERMRKIVECNMDDKKELVDNGVEKQAEILRRKTKQPTNMSMYISKSMANMKDPIHRPREVNASDRLKQEVRCREESQSLIPAPLVSRIQSMYIENIAAELNQKCDQLNEEINAHEQYVRDHGGPHAIKEFALPRKLRLQRETFASNLDKHQLQMNSVAMIGDIAKNLPRPTEDPAIIWQRLMHTAERRTTDGL